MEPITLALSAVAAIKTGVQMGKDITSLSKEVGQLWGAIDEVKDAHNKKKTKRFGSVEEEALDTFMAKKKAEDLENQLREIVISTRGFNGWQELLKIRGQIRKQRQEERERIQRRRRKILEIVILSVTLILGFWGIAVFALFLLNRHTGGA